MPPSKEEQVAIDLKVAGHIVAVLSMAEEVVGDT